MYRLKGIIVSVGLSIVFLAVVGLIVSGWHDTYGKDWIIVVIAAIFGGYMALNIGANDVANNMGPAVGGKVLTVLSAVLIAAVCESAGALLAGGDVVQGMLRRVRRKLFQGVWQRRYLYDQWAQRMRRRPVPGQE